MTVVHRAGPVVDGVQRCDRCGADLHAAPDGTGWEPGTDVFEARLDHGDHLSCTPVPGAEPCGPAADRRGPGDR